MTMEVIEREQTNESHLDVVAVKTIPLPAVTPEMFDALDAMPEGFSLQQAYLVFDAPGTTYRLLYVGMSEMYSPEQSKQIPLAVFMWRNPETRAIQRVVHAGDNLVKQLQNCPIMPSGTPIKVTFIGKEKANSGRTFNKFDVVVLNPTAAPIVVNPKPPQTPAQKWHKWASSTRATADNADDVRAGLKAAWSELGLSKPADVTTLQGAIDWLKDQTQN
jgi:hypothetical protein